MIQPENISVEEPPEIFFCGRYAVSSKKLANETEVSPAAELQSLEAVGGIELRGENLAKGLNPCPSSADQSAIDIKENQPDHAAAKLCTPSPCGNRWHEGTHLHFSLHSFWI